MIAISSFDAYSGQSCFEFRMGIEGEAAAAAARKRSAADLAHLEAVTQKMEALRHNGQPGLNEDFEFHLTIARASHNDYYVSVLQSLKATIFEGMLYARTTSGLKTAEKIAAINEQHGLVLDAIRSQAPDAARAAMREHLLRCRISTNHWQLA